MALEVGVDDGATWCIFVPGVEVKLLDYSVYYFEFVLFAKTSVRQEVLPVAVVKPDESKVLNSRRKRNDAEPAPVMRAEVHAGNKKIARLVWAAVKPCRSRSFNLKHLIFEKMFESH
jgi:hypothetical protein